MTSSQSLVYHRTLLSSVLCGLLFALSGCSTTPQAKLHGRWFNSEMSIRFRTDGTVVFNSTRGLASGRYFFNGELRPEASEAPVPNLTLDLVRGGEVFRVTYELQFLGSDRLRIQTIDDSDQGLPSDRILPIVILKRAEAANDNSNEVAAAGL